MASGSRGGDGGGWSAGRGRSRTSGDSGSGQAGAIEVSAKSVDEAVSQALRRLGLARADVDVEVLHAGSPGRLLGFGAEPARVRVTPIAVEEDDTEDSDSADGVDNDSHDAEETQPVGISNVSQRSRAWVTSPAAGVTQAGEAEVTADGEDEEAADEDDEETQQREADLARVMLSELLGRMGLGELRVEIRGVEPIVLNIRGGEVADLIGRRGENLRSLQFVLNLMLNKQLRKHMRVTVDVDGYRARREELLRGMAQRFAHRVRSTREPMQLEAMPPNERRIVHITLADDPDVETESIGEGDARRVVIRLKR